jgi:hypothetical protein
MKIFNGEYGFALTVGASAQIADLCPDGDLTRMGELLQGTFSQTVRFTAAFIEAMARGYDDLQIYEGKEITHEPLTARMVMALPSDVFRVVQEEALEAFRKDTETTVEVAKPKKQTSQKAAASR